MNKPYLKHYLIRKNSITKANPLIGEIGVFQRHPWKQTYFLRMPQIHRIRISLQKYVVLKIGQKNTPFQ